ncbi:hypothetical protein G7Y89_g10489 [Cudoniella acicularis]|uniref:NAD(P)-binding protein n=1 Tax=Cudoniella acicularis TaxID=354080 RepID=A0A8H4RCP3_9HELO|nr:hypothetical protein G7Y89_g10489 [Cudoniella acicularis]
MATTTTTTQTKPLVWLITGCSSGFGEALTLLALKNGHSVIAASRTPSRTPSLVKEVESLGGLWLQLDMTAPKSAMEKVVEEGVKKFGRIDVLVNNAGVGIIGPLEDVSEQEIQTIMATNFIGPLLLIQSVLPHMRSQSSGTIVNISSGAGIDPRPSMGLYGASKFALEGMSQGLSKEISPFGIRMLIVQPGVFTTNMMNAIMLNGKEITGAYENTEVGQKAPFEVRTMIFKLCLSDAWEGKIPALIKAVRQDQGLYHEALEIFYEDKQFVLHKVNGWSFNDMEFSAMLTIKKLEIVVEKGIMVEGLFCLPKSNYTGVNETFSNPIQVHYVQLGRFPPAIYRRRFQSTTNKTQPLLPNPGSLAANHNNFALKPLQEITISDASNVKELSLKFVQNIDVGHYQDLTFRHTHKGNFYDYSYFIYPFKNRLSKLELASTMPLESPQRTSPQFYERYKDMMGIHLLSGYSVTKVHPKLRTVYAGYDDGDRRVESVLKALQKQKFSDCWFWEVDKKEDEVGKEKVPIDSVLGYYTGN